MDKIFQIIGPYPPASYISVSGQRYACSGSCHVAIPMDMPYHEILSAWVDNNTTKTNRAHDKPKGRAWEVPSSKPGNPPYLVRLIDGHFDCHCKGYQFFSHCSHIQGVQEKLLLEKQKV